MLHLPTKCGAVLRGGPFVLRPTTRDRQTSGESCWMGTPQLAGEDQAMLAILRDCRIPGQYIAL
jgi:hypothetical protein